MRFVILQINTKQFPFEFINISDVDPQSMDTRGCISLVHVCILQAGRFQESNKLQKLSIKSAVD